MAVKPKTKSIKDNKVKKTAKVVSSTAMKKDSPKKKIEKSKKVGISTKKKEAVKKIIPIKSMVKVEIPKEDLKNMKSKAQRSVLSEKVNLRVKSVKEEKPKKSVAKKIVKTEKDIVPEVKENKILKNKKVSLDSNKKSKTGVQKTVVVNKEEIQSIKSKKRKHSESTEEVSDGSSGLDKKDVKKFVAALLKITADEEENKKKIFDSDQVPIFLCVTSIKVPKAPLRQLRIPLPHSLVQSTDEVALIVRDLKRGRRIPYENTVTHYEDLLRARGVTRVKTVIPMNQLKTEYRQYELRRKLLGLYDHFLVDGRIAGHVAHLLGKMFRTNRKLPNSIHMDKDLKTEIDNALRKTTFQIHSNGNSFVTQVGYNSMSVKDITDNILAVERALGESFPGGWGNIKKLSIKTSTSLSIPIYITLKNPNDVKVPVQAPKRPKAYKPVEGELLTSTANLKAIVDPDGTVSVVKIDDGSDAENEDNEENVEVEEEEDDEDDEDEESKASELDDDED